MWQHCIFVVKHQTRINISSASEDAERKVRRISYFFWRQGYPTDVIGWKFGPLRICRLSKNHVPRSVGVGATRNCLGARGSCSRNTIKRGRVFLFRIKFHWSLETIFNYFGDRILFGRSRYAESLGPFSRRWPFRVISRMYFFNPNSTFVISSVFTKSNLNRNRLFKDVRRTTEVWPDW